ncbi:SCO4226 family nickel-binding protein [Nonomuraea sp. NPDC051941]|uniref:SCO4226 family nickel-binding protein n=1 Tax=Nonomuraea TaxID=83681 RepID=UPI003332B24B
MAKFMDVHSGFVGVTEEQLRAAHERDLAIEESEGVHFERAWLDPESGKVFCLSSGPSKEAVLRVHEKAGHPTTEIYELPVEVE